MGTSAGKPQKGGMEPPDLDVGDGSSGPVNVSNGGTGFPTVKVIRAAQLQIKATQIEWLATCRRLCELRLPAEVFKSIPNDLWKLVPWGTKIVVMRAPKVDQHGMLVLPDMAQRSNFHGWVLTVGQDVCREDTPDSMIRGKTCPYVGAWDSVYNPLLLVGEMVQFNPHAGREISTARQLSPEKRMEFLITSIADVWGPIPEPDESDWSPKLL